jgi:hypothetical protein
VNDFVEWAVAGASQRRLPRNMYSGLSSWEIGLSTARCQRYLVVTHLACSTVLFSTFWDWQP